MLRQGRRGLGASTRTVAAFLLCGALGGGCAEAPVAVGREATVTVNFLTPATVRSLTIDISGPGIAPAVVVNLPVGADSVARGTVALPTGSGRRFVITAFDSAGIATHRADTTITIQSGSNPALTVRVLPLPSTLGVTVSFGGARVTVGDTSVRALIISDTVRITASAVRSTGSLVPSDSIVWATSNPAIVRVNGGLVTAIRPGTAQVVASYGGVSIRVAVRTRQVTAESVSLVTGNNHTCGLSLSGTAYCWGYNIAGTLGDGTNEDRSSPVAVVGGHTFTQLAAGSGHNCGLLPSGAALCWGFNGSASLGDSTTTNRTEPVAVKGAHEFTAIAAGQDHSCGLTPDGAAICWGSNGAGEVGDGIPGTPKLAPVEVAGGLSFRALSAGFFNFTCGVTAMGSAYCWGYGDRLGVGVTTNSLIPVAVSGGQKFVIVSAGMGTCGLTAAGTAYCWGRDVAVFSDSVVLESISSGGGHTCGLSAAGTAYCWGENLHGQLGDGTTTGSGTPVAVAGGRTFAALVAGGSHTCGLTTEGTAFCWGANDKGQLGDGTTVTRLVPVAVAGNLRFKTP